MDLGHRLRHGVLFVLVRPLQSGNVGAAARAMKNYGLGRLAIVAPPALDVDRARWMAPGAEEVLDEAAYCGTVAEAVAGCRWVVATTARKRHSHWPAFEPASLARECMDVDGDVAVLFGPEDHGLANEELAHAHALVHIPTGAHASINLAQAALLVGAALFGVARERGLRAEVEGPGRRGGPGRGAAPGATGGRQVVPAGALEPLVEDWLGALEPAGYFDGHEHLLVETTVRRILQRAALDGQELAVLRGMLKGMTWRMKNGGLR